VIILFLKVQCGTSFRHQALVFRMTRLLLPTFVMEIWHRVRKGTSLRVEELTLDLDKWLGRRTSFTRIVGELHVNIFMFRIFISDVYLIAIYYKNGIHPELHI